MEHVDFVNEKNINCSIFYKSCLGELSPSEALHLLRPRPRLAPLLFGRVPFQEEGRRGSPLSPALSPRRHRAPLRPPVLGAAAHRPQVRQAAEGGRRPPPAHHSPAGAVAAAGGRRTRRRRLLPLHQQPPAAALHHVRLAHRAVGGDRHQVRKIMPRVKPYLMPNWRISFQGPSRVRSPTERSLWR